jgi:plasmid stabilization system protein ParE
MVKKNVVWDDLAKASLKAAYNYIKRDSLQQAEKVKEGIITVTNKLAEHPEAYPPDKYRTYKDVRFRAFEKYNYRISYFIAEDEIRILRFRHVKQQPEEY